MAFIWGEFQKRYRSHYSLNLVWKLLHHPGANELTYFLWSSPGEIPDRPQLDCDLSTCNSVQDLRCPDDSQVTPGPPTPGQDLCCPANQECTCRPCDLADLSCDLSQVRVIHQEGTGLPGTCCDVVECIDKSECSSLLLSPLFVVLIILFHAFDIWYLNKKVKIIQKNFEVVLIQFPQKFHCSFFLNVQFTISQLKLLKCWVWSMPPYGITRSEWVKQYHTL